MSCTTLSFTIQGDSEGYVRIGLLIDLAYSYSISV